MLAPLVDAALSGASDRPRPGTRLGPYEVLGSPRCRRDGRGLPRAAIARLGREVAIKVLPRRSRPPIPTGSDASSRKRGPPAPSTIPNLLAVFDTGQHDGDSLRRVSSCWRARRCGSGCEPGALPARKAVGLRGPDRARPGRGPREGDRPPRPEAREPVRDHGRAREDPRLRPGQAVQPATAMPDDPATRARRSSRPRPGRASSWAPSATCRPSRSGDSRPTIGPTSSPSARCSTRCSRAGGRSGRDAGGRR